MEEEHTIGGNYCQEGWYYLERRGHFQEFLGILALFWASRTKKVPPETILPRKFQPTSI